MKISLDTSGIKSDNFSMNENNNGSVYSTSDTKSSGLFLIPSEGVLGRPSDITGYVISASTKA